MVTTVSTPVVRATARLVLRGRVDYARALDLLHGAECAARGVGTLDTAAADELITRLGDALELERTIAELAGAAAELGHCAQ